MNIKKSLLAVAVFMSVTAITFAQEPAKAKHPKAAKESKMSSDTTKAAHHHVKKVKEEKKG